VEALLGGLLPEGGEVGRDRHPGHDLGLGRLELEIWEEKSSVWFW
jgi:hypothetical protein